MNSVQAIGLASIIYDIAEWMTPNPIDKQSKKVFKVKAKKVNVKEARKAITAAKLHQCSEKYDYSEKEIVELENNIQKALENTKLSKHTIDAAKGGLRVLKIMTDALEIDPEDVKVYLREMHQQLNFLIKRGGWDGYFNAEKLF